MSACQSTSPTRLNDKPVVALEASNEELPAYSELTQKETQETLKRLQMMRKRQAAEEVKGYQGPIRHVWDRVLANKQIDFRDNLRIEKQATILLRNPEYLQRVSKRSEPFIYFILEEIKKRNLPAELALLPVIESAYRPTARSRSSAVGLWQFIPSTSRFLGMKSNWWYDARRDTIVATKYALDYLSTINKKFDGDWLLTLAAYNAGHGRVSRAMAKNRKAGKPTDFWSLKLPEETMHYVPRFLAVSRIFTQADDYQVSLFNVPNKPFFVQVNIDDQVDLNVAAEIAGIPAKTLKHYNAGFLRWATAPNGPHRLLLPIERSKGFTTKLAKLSEQERLRWVKHTVERGDTLTGIAFRYGIGVSLLKKTNKLRSSLIRPGDRLLVPLSHRKVAKNSSKKRNEKTARDANGKYHTVKRGDSLWLIARKYNLQLKKLLRLNKLKKNSVLQLGQQLLIGMKPADKSDTKKLALNINH